MSIGIVLSETGDPVGARAAYDKSLAIRQRLADDNPTVTTFQDDLANGYINLGSLLSRTGDAAGARAAYGKAIAIRQKLADANPGVIQFRQELAKSLNYLGNLLAATGDLAGARAAYGQALAIEQKQADANPDCHRVPAGPGDEPQQHRRLALTDGRARPRRGTSSARRWPSSKGWRTPTPASLSSSGTWR